MPLGLHPTASIQQPRSGPEPTGHFFEPSSLDCISTSPNYNLILPYTPARQYCLLPRDLVAISVFCEPGSQPISHLRLFLSLRPPLSTPRSLFVSFGLCPLPSAPAPLFSAAHSRSRYSKLVGNPQPQLGSYLHSGSSSGGYDLLFRFPSQRVILRGLRSPIRELITRPAHSLPALAGCEVAGSGVKSGTSSLAWAGAGRLCDGLGAPGARGEGRSGAALVPEIREGGSCDQALLWPPPGLGATRPRSLGRGLAQP